MRGNLETNPSTYPYGPVFIGEGVWLGHVPSNTKLVDFSDNPEDLYGVADFLNKHLRQAMDSQRIPAGSVTSLSST